MNKQLTVNDLFALCDQAIKEGNGDKNIVISDDNEGNSYHGLFYGFTLITEDEDYENEIYDSLTHDISDTIILG